jgi:hypothetical protein
MNITFESSSVKENEAVQNIFSTTLDLREFARIAQFDKGKLKDLLKWVQAKIKTYCKSLTDGAPSLEVLPIEWQLHNPHLIRISFKSADNEFTHADAIKDIIMRGIHGYLAERCERTVLKFQSEPVPESYRSAKALSARLAKGDINTRCLFYLEQEVIEQTRPYLPYRTARAKQHPAIRALREPQVTFAESNEKGNNGSYSLTARA